MELSAFVTATLLEIMKGVSDACQRHPPHIHGGFVNPTRKSKSNDFDCPAFGLKPPALAGKGFSLGLGL
jgi:hypothetical protein